MIMMVVSWKMMVVSTQRYGHSWRLDDVLGVPQFIMINIWINISNIGWTYLSLKIPNIQISNLWETLTCSNLWYSPNSVATPHPTLCSGRRCAMLFEEHVNVINFRDNQTQGKSMVSNSSGWYTYPSEKYESQFWWWNSQYMESHKSHVPVTTNQSCCGKAICFRKNDLSGDLDIELWMFTVDAVAMTCLLCFTGHIC